VSALELLSRAHQDLTRTSLGLGALRALLSLGPELWMVRGVLAEDVDRVLVGLAAWLLVELTAGAWIDARLGAAPGAEPRTDATRIALVRGLIPWLWCLAPALVLATRIFARDGWTPPELVRPVLVTAVGTLICATIGLRQHLAHAQAYARRPSEPAAPTPETPSAPTPAAAAAEPSTSSAPAALDIVGARALDIVGARALDLVGARALHIVCARARAPPAPRPHPLGLDLLPPLRRRLGRLRPRPSPGRGPRRHARGHRRRSRVHAPVGAAALGVTCALLGHLALCTDLWAWALLLTGTSPLRGQPVRPVDGAGHVAWRRIQALLGHLGVCTDLRAWALLLTGTSPLRGQPVRPVDGAGRFGRRLCWGGGAGRSRFARAMRDSTPAMSRSGPWTAVL
jgi:hypothetical protein